MRNVDTLIIGGGAVGCSTAYHLSLARRNSSEERYKCDGIDESPSIVVIEKDPTYAHASSTLSAGGIRQQFSLKENVQMSLYGRDFIRSAKDTLFDCDAENDNHIQFCEQGYLFLASTDEGRTKMVKNNKTQRDAGCDSIHILNGRGEIRRKFPWMNCDDLVAASFGESGEGWFDPWALIRGLKASSEHLGVSFVHGVPIGAKRGPGGEIISVDVELYSTNGNKAVSRMTFNVNTVVNAAGAFASCVLDLLAGTDNPCQHPLPVRPRKRCIFFFHCAAPCGIPVLAPLTIDPSGVYFRPEGGADSSTFICGVSPPPEEDFDCMDVGKLEVDHALFEERIWPILYHRVPAFGDIKVKSSWAGLYEYNTVDQNAIIGFHPEIGNCLLLNGFSGHGLQQSPAVGLGASELIDHGKFLTLDLSSFSFQRFLDGGNLMYEEGIV